jgi:ribosomal protein S13
MKAVDAVKQLTDEVMEEIEQVLDNKPKTENDFRN